uniref:INTS8 TPR repeats domain-containing protein n=1 Tax=Plectus sambesii TaxID=2011161 RepID=A0A914V4V8_9BILA
MDCRTQEALVCQLMRDPTDSYQAAAKALEASVVYDASTAYLPLLFDSRLMEYAADTYAKMGLTHKVELVLRAMSSQDMNIHNVPAICARETNKRKVRLLKTLCAQYFRLFD